MRACHPIYARLDSAIYMQRQQGNSFDRPAINRFHVLEFKKCTVVVMLSTSSCCTHFSLDMQVSETSEKQELNRST